MMSILDPKRARAEADRELDEGIELLRAAHQRKLQAIQVLEMMAGSGEREATPKAKAQSKELKRGELPAAFDRVLPKLDPGFDKKRVYATLTAFEPDVAALTTERSVSLLLSRLAKRGQKIEVIEEGEGRAPTKYKALKPGPKALEPVAEAKTG